MRAGRVRILLLTPYNGDNLGDQAIQRTLIDSFKLRLPSAEIIGLTLNPRATAAIHGISCFPLSAKIAPATLVKVLQWPEEPPLAANGHAVVNETPHPASAPLDAATRTTGQHGATALSMRSRILAILRHIPFLLNVLRALRNAPREAVFTIRAARLVHRGDLLLVAGGGQIDDEWGGTWAHPFTLWRWTGIAQLKGAWIGVASVGWGQLSTKLSARFIRTSLRRADYQSFRDKGSALMAEALALPDGARYVPDIALGLPVSTTAIQWPVQTITTVGLSPIAFGRSGTWPTAPTGVYENYLKRMKDFVRALTERGMKVVLFTTARMDQAAIEDLLDLLQDLPDAHRSLLSFAKTTTLESLFTVLATCQVVVASRLHGVILAHRLCLPTLAISPDRKVDAHMADVGHSEFCLDIRHLGEGEVEGHFASFASRTDDLRAELCRFVDAAQPALTAQFDTLAGMVCSSSAAKSTMGE